ncbi:MAG TPA: hypothetical protein VNN73_12360 [Blastocatellia bacterium]|jgi:hypothetical protein|nr:hypothetical protein [Blastocatellia bacterium]
MNESLPAQPQNALITLLRSSLDADGAPAFGQLVLYTSFGVVRGRVGLSFAQRLLHEGNGDLDAGSVHEVIELNDVSVEHYSNHLPTASFVRLYVRLSEVQGFALVDLQGQS